MGILPCCTSRGKTSMKPSSIDDPVAWYRPSHGQRDDRPPARQHREPAAPRPPQRAAEHERARRARRRRRRRIVRAGRSSPEMVSSRRRRSHGLSHGLSSDAPIVADADLQWYADDLNRSRHPAGARAGVARPRRSRRRRLGGARRRVHAPLGGGRAGDHAPHVGGRRRTGHAHDATATTWSGGGAATRCSRGPSPARSAGRWVGTTRMVEIWNGVPWFSPVWRRKPGITVLHHVHGPMWDQILPGPLASFGRALEARLAPPFYRRSLTVDAVGRHPGRAARTRLPPRSGARRSRTAPIRVLLAGRQQDRRTRRSSRSGGWRP